MYACDFFSFKKKVFHAIDKIDMMATVTTNAYTSRTWSIIEDIYDLIM